MTQGRFGLVGTGHWSRTVHAPSLVGSPDVELVGVHGRDVENTTAFAHNFGSRFYPDFDELLADVDAVAFAVPPDVQVGLATRAARAGKHLFLEKPPALDLEEADRLVE